MNSSARMPTLSAGGCTFCLGDKEEKRGRVSAFHNSSTPSCLSKTDDNEQGGI